MAKAVGVGGVFLKARPRRNCLPGMRSTWAFLCKMVVPWPSTGRILWA